MAMLIGVVFAACVLVYARSGGSERLRSARSSSLKPIANVLVIIAGGGAFQHVLTDAKVGDAIVHLSQLFALSPLILGWLISMLLSVSPGRRPSASSVREGAWPHLRWRNPSTLPS